MPRYFSLDIICSSKSKVRFSKQIVFADKYPDMFSCQIEAPVDYIAVGVSILSLDTVWTIGYDMEFHPVGSAFQ